MHPADITAKRAAPHLGLAKLFPNVFILSLPDILESQTQTCYTLFEGSVIRAAYFSVVLSLEVNLYSTVFISIHALHALHNTVNVN